MIAYPDELHTAVEAALDDGEIAVAWTLTIDIAGPDESRYLQHCSGGGADAPTIWAAIGMLRSALLAAEQQLMDSPGQ